MYNLYSGNPSTQLDNGGFIIGKEEVLLGVGRGGGQETASSKTGGQKSGRDYFCVAQRGFFRTYLGS